MKLTSKMLIHLIKEQMKDTISVSVANKPEDEKYPDSQSTFEKIKTLMFNEETYETGLILLSSTDKLRPDHADALERIRTYADLFYKAMLTYNEYESLGPKDHHERYLLFKKRLKQKAELRDKFEELFGIQSNLGREVKLAFRDYFRSGKLYFPRDRN